VFSRIHAPSALFLQEKKDCRGESKTTLAMGLLFKVGEITSNHPRGVDEIVTVERMKSLTILY